MAAAPSPKEEILEPELPICDPHHHLWDFPNSRYFLPELLADVQSGHNVQSTVFVECTSFYRASGPEEMASIATIVSFTTLVVFAYSEFLDYLMVRGDLA